VRFAKSIVDYIFRWMASKFLSAEAQFRAGVNNRDEATYPEAAADVPAPKIASPTTAKVSATGTIVPSFTTRCQVSATENGADQKRFTRFPTVRTAWRENGDTRSLSLAWPGRRCQKFPRPDARGRGLRGHRKQFRCGYGARALVTAAGAASPIRGPARRTGTASARARCPPRRSSSSPRCPCCRPARRCCHPGS